MKEITRYGCEYCTQVFEDKDSCLNHEELCEYNSDKFTRVSGTMWTINFAMATGEYEEPRLDHYIWYEDSEGKYYRMSYDRPVLVDTALDVPEVLPGPYGTYHLLMYTFRKDSTSIAKELIAYLNKWVKERAKNIVDKGMTESSTVWEMK